MADNKRGRSWIGTSGWDYPHWKGPFYPGDIRSGDTLSWYAGRFGTVEINSSFYRLPSEETVTRWADATPPDFKFACKASRYITHMKKLKDSPEITHRFLDRVGGLGPKLGPILFQLPPGWRADADRLRDFIGGLPSAGAKAQRFAFEFRDRTWYSDEVLHVLEEGGCALCISHIGGEKSPRVVTTDFVYIRLHGPGEAYKGRYDCRTLAGWAGAVSSWTASGRDVFCYFDNDEEGFAADNALELKEMLI